MSETQEDKKWPNHEVIRAIGQMTVQAGLFLIAVSSVIKHYGCLPDEPILMSGQSLKQNVDTGNQRSGYFD